MKLKFIIISIFFAFPIAIIAQSFSEIANVYVKRAEESFYNLEMDKSLEIFTKALKYMDSVPNSKVARLGTLLYYEHDKYFEARTYAENYFHLEKDKSKEEYQNMLETYVDLQEKIEIHLEELKASELERQRKERETKRLDSLAKLWTSLSKEYTIAIDSIHKFNKYNLAVFSKEGKIGIMNDVGVVIEKPLSYTDFVTYDGFILMLDKPENPTKIYAFNCNSKTGFLLPSISAFNSVSTHYGKVMLPRANGLLVTYPDNSNKAYVYNLIEKGFFENAKEVKDILKNLKKNDIIDKYNNDGQVRIKKEWYTLGNLIGSGVYGLYNNDELVAYLNTSDGKLLDVTYYNYLGGFYDGNFELLEGDKRFWMDVEGIKQETNKNENGKYSGNSRFIKNAERYYVIIQNKEGKDYLVYGDKMLLTQSHFINDAPH